MNMKKLMLSATLLGLLLLSACSSGTDKAAKPVNKDEKVTINYYTWESASADIIKEKIANFEKENPNIVVNFEPLVTNNDSLGYYRRLDVKFGTGQPVDVVAFSNADFLAERAARGVLEPLDSFLKADSINPENEFYINPKYENKTFGIQDISQPSLVAINKKALDEAGLPVPTWGWTWDDFREYAKKLKKGKRYGAYFHTWGEYDNFIAYSELSHPYLTKDKKPVFDDESFKYFFNLRRSMEKDGLVKEFKDITAAKLDYATEFFNGEAAMVPTASFFVNLIKDQVKYPHDFQTVFAPLPRSSKDIKIGASNVEGHYLSVGNSSKHKKEAYKFALYMSKQTDVVSDFPGSKNVDKNVVIDKMIGDSKNLIDKESLVNSVYDKRVYIPYNPNYTTVYASQLKKVLEDGFSKFILDGISAEDAQKWMVDQANDIISRFK
ncbi:ABC transporter substrate-binding protein [Microbacteriaceae bacterium 4G12]